MKGFFKQHVVVLLMSLFFCICAIEPGFAQSKKLVLNFKHQRLSADIKHAPLKEVLVEFKEETKIWVNTGFTKDPTILDGDISVEFNDVTVKEGLERILSGINHSLIFAGNKVVGVMLFGKPGKSTLYRRTPYRRRPSTSRFGNRRRQP